MLPKSSIEIDSGGEVSKRKWNIKFMDGYANLNPVPD